METVSCTCTFEGPTSDNPLDLTVPGRIASWCPEARRLSWEGSPPETYSWAAYCAHIDAARAARAAGCTEASVNAKIQELSEAIANLRIG